VANEHMERRKSEVIMDEWIGDKNYKISFNLRDMLYFIVEVRTRVEQKLPELFEDTKEMEDFSSLSINKLMI
jgi:soluble cytochrome b562